MKIISFATQLKTSKLLAGWFRTIVLSIGISFALATLLVPPVICSEPDHLEYHEDWLCTKKTRGMGLMGGDDIRKNGDALKGGHVNLGAWYGFHEILFYRQLVPEQVAFRFMLAQGAAVTCVFNKTPDGFEGIRLSVNPANPSAYIRGADTGEFIEKRLLALPGPLGENVWHQSRLSFSGGAISLEVDGQIVSISRNSADNPGFVGFRGGYGDTFVDDVVILERGNSWPYTEDFSKRAPFGRLGEILQTILGAAAYVFIPVLFTTALLKKQWRLNSKRFLVGYALFMAAMTASFLFLLLSNQEPPTMQEMQRHRTEYNSGQLPNAQRGQQEFTKQYLMRPLENATRIVFVGSSQTWGVGARNDSESFVKVLESLLNARTGAQRRIECFNGGIQGCVARYLLRAYAETYIKVKPALTVVNLSCNDYWNATPDFAASLAGIVQINQAAGIKTLFVLEAASPDVFPDGFPTYPVMSRVASESGIPLFNAHECLAQHRDDGFLFWDMVHPTSCGHRLLAECLLPPIVAQLGIDVSR